MSYQPLETDSFLFQLRETRNTILAKEKKYIEEKISTHFKTPLYDDVKLLKRATDYFIRKINVNARMPGFRSDLNVFQDDHIPGFDILKHLCQLSCQDKILNSNNTYLVAWQKYAFQAFTILMASISEQTGIGIREGEEYKNHKNGTKKLSEGISLQSGEKYYYFHIWW